MQHRMFPFTIRYGGYPGLVAWYYKKISLAGDFSSGNTAQLCLRRFAKILPPDFVTLSCNTSSIAAKTRRIRTQNILANRSCQIMRYCPKFCFGEHNVRNRKIISQNRQNTFYPKIKGVLQFQYELGGDGGDRTHDLLTASQTLSQSMISIPPPKKRLMCAPRRAAYFLIRLTAFRTAFPTRLTSLYVLPLLLVKL